MVAHNKNQCGGAALHIHQFSRPVNGRALNERPPLDAEATLT